MTLALPDVWATLDATWPAAERCVMGEWVLRRGAGGGKRVSAATSLAPGAKIAEAIGGMRALGQRPLFMIRASDAALDVALAARGFALVDPVVIYAAETAALASPPAPVMTTFPLWPPLAIAREIWAAGGIGPERLAVMDRVAGPKTSILGRSGGRTAGVAFVATHGAQAMLHALEVVPERRRQGTAGNILRAAAAWAHANGARWLSLAVTEANDPACNLYASLGMSIVGHYHYREE